MTKMRKILALTMVALLSLIVALAAIGCGQQNQGGETTTTTTTTTTETTTMPDTGMMMPESTGVDTSVH
jgi:hypothetical protein